jgi:hypothetical protein
MSGSRRYYSLASLLDAQPRGLVRDSRHRLMWDHFMASEKLQRLRISGRCYRLLNRASVSPENLKTFCRTWRLPEDPFFPLFLAVKKAWMEDMRLRREKRRADILSIMSKLPLERRRVLDALAGLEKSRDSRSGHPVWDRTIVPKTLKQAQSMCGFDDDEWIDLWRTYLEHLTLRYRQFTPTDALRAEAKLLLGMDDCLTGNTPPASQISQAFRRLSKVHHPDQGGSPGMFRRLKTARDLLLDDQTCER